MFSDVVKLVLILVILVLWLVGSYWACKAGLRVYRMKAIDPVVTFRLLWKTLDPLKDIAGLVRERAELQVSMIPQEGYTFRPEAGDVVSVESMKDRRQYSLVIANDSKETFGPVRLRVQLPYPIEEHRLAGQTEVEGVTFEPDGVDVTVHGGGQLRVTRKPLYKNYELGVSELRPQGRLEVLFVLNSWRDPRGKAIPKGEEKRFLVPESGPTLTYIHGYFKYHVGGETVEREYYAPIELHSDKSVSLGTPRARPGNLAIRGGFE